MDIQAVYMLWCTHLWHVGLLNLSPWVGSQSVVLGWESYLGQNVLSFWVESFKTVLRIVMFYKWLNQCWNWCNGTHLYHSYYFVGTGGVNYCTYYDTPSNYSVLELAPHAVRMYTTRYTLYFTLWPMLLSGGMSPVWSGLFLRCSTIVLTTVHWIELDSDTGFLFIAENNMVSCTLFALLHGLCLGFHGGART